MANPAINAWASGNSGTSAFAFFSEYLTVTVDDDLIPSIITSVSINAQNNYQFLHSLENLIYVYSFGERIGELTISGLGWINPRAQSGLTNIGVGSGSGGLLSYFMDDDGLTRMDIMSTYKKYEDMKGSENAGRLVKINDIVLSNWRSSIELRGVLRAMRIDMTSDNDDICNWSMTWSTVLVETHSTIMG